MLWYTTPPVTVEHALCIWMVRTFVDPESSFETISRDNGGLPADARVLGPASKPAAILKQYKVARKPELVRFIAEVQKADTAALLGPRGTLDPEAIISALNARYTAGGAGAEHARLLGALPVGVVVIADGVIEYVNARAATMLGRPVERLLHSGIDEFGFQFTDHQGNRLGTPDKVFRVAASRVEPMDGLQCEVEGAGMFIGSLQRMEGDRLLLCLTDATRLITVERALRRSEERYRSLMDAIPYGVEEFNPDGIITFANKALHKIMEYDEGEIVGKPVWYFKKHENIKHELGPMLKQWIKERPEPFAYFARNLTKSGREIDTRGDWDYQYDEHGNAIGFVGVVTDVTDITRREEDFKRMLDELYDLRNKFATNGLKLPEQKPAEGKQSE